MKIPGFILSEPIGFHAPALAGWLARYETIGERFATAETISVTLRGNERAALTLEDFIHARRPYQVTPEGVAVIHANEALSRTSTRFEQMLGDTHYNQLIDELALAGADSKVRGVFLDISSPGGSALGAPEAAAAVAAVRDRGKPVVSYVETIGAIAAYYFAAASTQIFASPSAIVGSIGTISIFPNIAEALAKEGVAVHIFTPEQSDLKAAGNMFRVMTEQERAFLQARIEAMNADFVQWVQKYRPNAASESLRGQWFSGTQAMSAGLVNQTGTRADAFAALGISKPPAFAPSPKPAAPLGKPGMKQLAEFARPEMGCAFDPEKEAADGSDALYLAARIERLRFEIERCSGEKVPAFESTPPQMSRGYGRKAITYADDSPRMRRYKGELETHLRAILADHEDTQFAAAVAAQNFPNLL